MDNNTKKAFQEELRELFKKYDVSVGTGLTREGITILSQDERVDAKNIGPVYALNTSSAASEEPAAE